VDSCHVPDGGWRQGTALSVQGSFEVGVRNAVYTVSKCGFVVRYQNTSNLEQHCIRGGTDHKELADRLTPMQQLERQDNLGSGEDGRMVLSRTFNTFKACVVLTIVYENTLLMQGNQYPTCNLVIPQLYQMITKLEMSIITYVMLHVKCGPRISKVLRQKKMTLKKMTLK
jgi:hypothetical protein